MRGFTLVELLVALALGALVVAAALGFFVQLLRAGSETVLSMRLQREMRATMALVVAEVRRARVAGHDVAATPACFRGEAIAIRAREGQVEVARGAGVGCDSVGNALGSDAVRVTALRFARDAEANDRRVEVELTGALRRPPAFATTREVVLRQVVALRSNGR